MSAYDLLMALGQVEMLQFLGLMILMDVPRYLLSSITLALLPPTGGTDDDPVASVSGLVACHNEEQTIGACIASMRANGIEQIVVVNDGSSDRTREIVAELGVVLIDMPERIGKPLAMNVGMKHCSNELVLVADADTVFEPGSVVQTLSCFEPDVAGVGFDLSVSNLDATLTTRYQAIEYAISLSTGRRIADAIGILPNVSGAAGIFRRQALQQVDGWDCEVAEDAALAMKLRQHGWELRFAAMAMARTTAPETVVDLMMQRMRWDASIITIWWRKFSGVLNPLGPRFSAANLLTSLDVLVFNALMPLILPVYLFWLWTRIDEATVVLVGATLIATMLLDVVIILLLSVPLRLLLYVPYYVVMQTFVMRPLRVVALVAELAFTISRRDDYIPAEQRHRLT